MQWGFSTVLNYSDEIEIDKVEGPTFEAGQTEEMTQARNQFDKIMANKSSATSPEALAYAKKCLGSEDRATYEEGQDVLYEMAGALLEAFTRIYEIKDKAIFKRFVLPHLERADKVLDLMYDSEMSHIDEYSQLNAAFKELSARYNEE